MKKIILTSAMVSLTFIAMNQSIKDLDFLIGKWEVNETIYPGTSKSWTENGTRVCEYYLDSFIKCESSTTDSRNGKNRKYAYIINYDKKSDCFRATNFANDFPLQGQFEWYLDSVNQQILAITPLNVVPDRFFRGTISFADSDSLVWDGWASIYREEKEWQQIFHDVATKKQ